MCQLLRIRLFIVVVVLLLLSEEALLGWFFRMILRDDSKGMRRKRVAYRSAVSDKVNKISDGSSEAWQEQWVGNNTQMELKPVAYVVKKLL